MVNIIIHLEYFFLQGFKLRNFTLGSPHSRVTIRSLKLTSYYKYNLIFWVTKFISVLKVQKLMHIHMHSSCDLFLTCRKITILFTFYRYTQGVGSRALIQLINMLT
jgi:hypothetical protein